MQYRDGQIYLAQASTIVDGQGTDFTAFCKAGDRLFIRNESVSYVIESVLAKNKLRLTAPYRKTSKTTAYSVQLDYSAHFRLMMPYLGDFNVEDMLRLNIGKLDAMMHAACGGATSRPYTLEIVSLLLLAATDNSQGYQVKINTSHAQPVRISVTLNGERKVDDAPITASNGVYGGSFTNLAAGSYQLNVEVHDAKGNAVSRDAVFTVGQTGAGAAAAPNTGAWTFTPSTSGVGGRVDSTENNVIVGFELIENGVALQPWTTQKSALRVPTGDVLAGSPGDFSGYPVKIKVWNLARQEVWRWDAADATAILESGGGLNLGGGTFTVTASPATPVPDGQEYRVGWTALANEASVIIDAELYYWTGWQDWYHYKINLDQTTATLSSKFWGDKVGSDAFPLKYRLKNATKTVTISYASATAAAVIDSVNHASTTSAPEAIVSLDSVTQITGTQNATVVFQVASNHASLATEWLIEVDGVAVTAWVAAAFNQVSTITHTLTGLSTGSRNIIVRGRGASMTSNNKTRSINITSSGTEIPAPVLSNFVITPGQGSATFTLDISDTRPVEYWIFRDGVEIFHAPLASLTAINQSVDVVAGSGSFYISVSNDSHRQSATAHINKTINPRDAGAAVITQPVAQISTDTEGTQHVDIIATVDVPDGSYGIHYRFYRYLTGSTPPADDPSLRGGFDWVQHSAAPVEVSQGYPQESQNYTYALDAKPQGGLTFTTATVDVAGQAASGTGTMTVIVDSTSTVDAASYTITATVSNSASEAQEYRILQEGSEKVGWTTLANHAQFSRAISATAGTYSVVIEARTASIATITKTLAITVNAAAGNASGVVSPGADATQGNLKVTLNSVDFSVDPVVVGYTAEIITATAGQSIWVASKPQWTTSYGTFYEKASGIENLSSFGGLEAGQTVKLKWELRDASEAVLATIETIDLVKP